MSIDKPLPDEQQACLHLTEFLDRMGQANWWTRLRPHSTVEGAIVLEYYQKHTRLYGEVAMLGTTWHSIYSRGVVLGEVLKECGC